MYWRFSHAAFTVDGDVDFQPEYDADGNQTRVKTSTGIWAVNYDSGNRPIDFYRIDSTGGTTVHCTYDHMGRRATKQVTVGNNVTLHQRYIYRGYLQVACIDLTRSHHPALWYITWDATQPVATRPLAIQLNGTWYTYGWDLTKNICELYGQHGYLRTAYTYTPYGQVTAEGDVEQAIQWSSEFNDTELGLVYYNYRHYNPVEGRWIGRDGKNTRNGLCYDYVTNNSVSLVDYLGNDGIPVLLPDSLSWYMFKLYQNNKYSIGRYSLPTKENVSKTPGGTYSGLTMHVGDIDFGLPRKIKMSILNRHHILRNVEEQITEEIVKNIRKKDKGIYKDTKSTIDSYGFGHINFALGDGIVGTYTKYRYEWCPLNELKQGRLSWTGDILVHYIDVFKNPFRTAGIGITYESGIPYAYEYKWRAPVQMDDVTVF